MSVPMYPPPGGRTDSDARVRRFFRFTDLLLVAGGGALGSLARHGVSLLVPATSVDWPLLVVNLVGAFCLGLLLEALERQVARGDEGRRHRRLRLGVGTGFLGGFTSYSALAVGTLVGRPAEVAVTQLVVIVVGGLLAVLLGIAIGSRLDRRASGTGRTS